MMRILFTSCALAFLAACADSGPEQDIASTSSAVCAGPVVHSLRYDVHGRKREIQRPGVGGVEYVYDPVSGLLTQKLLSDRTVELEYDGLGRLIEERAVKGTEIRTVQLHYDEAGAVGFLTRVEGPGWEKRLSYGRDGTVDEVTFTIPGFRSVSLAHEYYVNGYTRSTERTIRDASGVLLSQLERTTRYDQHGRPAVFEVNGQTLFTTHYDAEGRVERVSFTDGSTLTFAHDLETHQRNGYAQRGDFDLEAAWSFDQRGLVSSESFVRDTEAFTTSYAHDARGFLVSATGAAPATYAYDPDGRPATGPRSGTMQIGGVTYVFDASGRVVQKDNLLLEYGPSGDIERATIGARVLTFEYDEAGRRIIKRENGAITAAYLFGGYLDANAFIDPVFAGDRLVGVLVDDQFTQIGTDPRGSAVAGGGSWDWPTPYGARVLRPGISLAIDYAEKGFDPDLGTIRMGIRDFDPDLAQFWTPDPLFFEEDPRKCIESPVECNLFGYANNDPLRYRDPSGRNAFVIRDENTKTITVGAHIKIYGSKASKAVASQIEKDIETEWGRVKTWKDPKSGQVYGLKVNVTVRYIGKDLPASREEQQALRSPYGGNNLIEINSVGRSYVQGPNTGEWNVQQIQNRTGRVTAHEFGHLLGIDDKYLDSISGGKVVGSFPKRGWSHADLMANSWDHYDSSGTFHAAGQVNKKTWDLVLPHAFSKRPDVRTGADRRIHWYLIDVKDFR